MYPVFKYTFLEILRSRVYLSVIGCLLLITGISWIGSSFTYTTSEVIQSTLAFGMNLTQILVLAMALFLPANHLAGEQERGTAQVLWAKCSSRSVYYSGKYFSFLLLALLLIVLATCFIGLLTLLQGASKQQILFLGYFVYGQFLETACVLSLLFLFFALVHSPFLASISSLLLVYTSVFLETARDVAMESHHLMEKLLYSFIYLLIPKLSYFNLETPVVYAQTIPVASILFMGLYALIFSGVLLMLGNLILARREF